MPNWCHRFMQLYLAKYSIDAGFRWLNKHCIFFELERRVCAARAKQSIEVRICVDTFNNPVASGCAKHEHKKEETKKKNWNPVAVIHILFPCHGVPYHLGLRMIRSGCVFAIKTRSLSAHTVSWAVYVLGRRDRMFHLLSKKYTVS